MYFHEPHRAEFLSHAAVTADQLTGPVARYGVALQTAQVAAGATYWRVIGIYHLTPAENRGGHAIFVDALDEQGKPIYDPRLQLRWGWEGQHADERADPKPLDKRPPEPATNIDLFRRQKSWVEIAGEGLPSDRVSNLHSEHPDELGPQGEIWSGNGHHSFYIAFQRTRKGAASQPAVTTPVITTPVVTPPGTTPGTTPHLPVVNIDPATAVSNQDMLNAFALAAGQLLETDPWFLLTKAGMSAHALSADRTARYGGLPIPQLPNLSEDEKTLLKQKLAFVLTTMPVPPRPSSQPSQPAVTAPVVTPPLTPPPAPVTPTPSAPPSPPTSPTPPAQGNRLGFYLHLSIDQNGLWDAIRQVQPPVILVHADTVNNMLLQEIRAFRAPNAFVVARLFKDSNAQRAMLTQGDPAANGRAMADEILALDFGMATKRGSNGRLLIDAWITLNEAIPGPASRQFAENPAETTALLRAYDSFQVAFRTRLQEQGIEAVAFNFAAGNFTRPEHYLDYFPKTLANYTYLGFHEYGWPTLQPAAGSATSATFYRSCLEGIRALHGPRHRVIMTEAGLARMYKDGSAGDVGWLNDVEPLSQDAYWQSLAWYNQQLLADAYVVGACLFEVGHDGHWASFRHLGSDHNGQPLRLMDRIAALNPVSRGRRRARGAREARGAETSDSVGFVRVHGQEFVVNGRALRFIGLNMRGLAHYGDAQVLPATNPDQQREAIRVARDLGVRVIRIFLPHVKVDTATTINRLRRLIEIIQAEAPGIYILPALCNLYGDVEFRMRGDDNFYEQVGTYTLLNAAFYRQGYRTNYLPFVQQVVQAFRDEAAIFAWEIGNELKLNPLNDQALESDPNIDAFLSFMHNVAQEIRRLDPNHLVTTGMISTHHAWLHTPKLRQRLYGNSDFDFLTVHCYNNERENDDHDLARDLNKPLIVEEAGYSRPLGSDSSGKYQEDLAYWQERGARGYMPWGFIPTPGDNGDGDDKSGIDRKFHSDWDAIVDLLRRQASQLANTAITLPPLTSPTTAASSDSSGAFLPGLQIGQTVFATDWLNIRKSPGYVGKLGDDVVGMVAPATPATISGASMLVDGLLWWPVRTALPDGAPVEGWAAQAIGATQLLSTQQRRGRGGAAGMAPRPRGRGVARGQVARGTEAAVARSSEEQRFATTTVNLRQSPGYAGKAGDDVIGEIPSGAQVILLGASAQADALLWLTVRAPLRDNRSATGWAAEFDQNGNQLLSPVQPPPPAPIVGEVHGAPFGPGTVVQLLGNASLLAAPTPDGRQELGQTVGAAPVTSKATVVDGPRLEQGLEWWQVTQSLANGQNVVGWAPLASAGGTRLLAESSLAQAISVGLPFGGTWAMSQGWGNDPAYYGHIPYDGVFLKGHNGLDFATPVFTPILATDDGFVQRIGYEADGFGNFVILQHRWGESLYAHLAKVDVLGNATLLRGQQLGLSGDSGKVWGAHLHFGIRIYPYRRTDGWGGFVNPIPFMQLQGIALPRGRGRLAPMGPEFPDRRRP